MKYLPIVLLLVGMATLFAFIRDVGGGMGFLLWMGGFVTSEILAWLFKPCAKEKSVA